MSYKYDVFISYKRDYKSKPEEYAAQLRLRWLRETFMPHFEFALSGEIGRDPQVFWDETEFKTGQDMKVLMNNLAGSKCLVAILSNPYLYDSEWCLREFCFMKHRKKTSNETYPNVFLLPLLYQTTDTNHPLICDLKFADYTKYNKVGKAFESSPEFINFQDAVNTAAGIIKDVILDPPEWNSGWIAPEWENEVNLMVEENRKRKFKIKISSNDVQY